MARRSRVLATALCALVAWHATSAAIGFVASRQQHRGSQVLPGAAVPSTEGNSDIPSGTTSSVTPLRRRQLATAVAGSLLVVPAWDAQPQAAEAVFGLFEEKPYVPYTVLGTYNISMPAEFKVMERSEKAIQWQGDRIQPLDVMSAAGKVVTYTSLAEGLGANITEVGERLAAKRPWGSGATTCVNATQDPSNSTLDIYTFEFVSDRLHELLLFALVKRGSERVLCNVALRTPPLLWESKRDVFNSILATFKPLEAQVEVMS